VPSDCPGRYFLKVFPSSVMSIGVRFNAKVMFARPPIGVPAKLIVLVVVGLTPMAYSS
jgi:hypothetical protein